MTGDEPSDNSVSLTIDGAPVRVPSGTLVIRAAETVGVQIPRFCDHPLLDPVGACRQCLVEVVGQRKPVASCTIPVTEGMEVHTQLSSPVAARAQRDVMELLLINHPLDCPVCDKGGECPLQNQAMSTGRAESRFHGVKRTFPKPIAISEQVLLDRERCVQCARCTRFSEQIAGDPFIELMERGAAEQVGIYDGPVTGPDGHTDGAPFDSYFSGNAVQICPVGALTGTAYRFRARPFDLVSSPSVCEHCASGCAQRTDHRRGTVLRRLAGDDPQVNQEWNCDKGRWAFGYPTLPDRLTTPLVAGEPVSWAHALAVAATGLGGARGRTGVLVGGRVGYEDAYAYTKFARIVLRSNDIDFRARAHSIEESGFLAARIAGRPLAVGYADLVAADTVLLAGLEPEDESPIVALRLRRAVRAGSLRVYSIAPYASRGLRKLAGRLIATVPGAEAQALAGADDLLGPASVIVVGERLAAARGALTAAARLADRTGAKLAWIPRRAGERGALEAGAMPELLPGGRPVDDAIARAQVARVWGVPDLPTDLGSHTGRMCAADTRAFLVGGVDPADLPQPRDMLAALSAAPFVVSLELRTSAVTELADVVFPVAAVVEKAGTFLDWEGRPRPFEAALRTAAMSDHRVLDAIARELGDSIDTGDLAAIRRELAELGSWDGTPGAEHGVHPVPAPRLMPGEAILATWHQLLDLGRLQDGDGNLAATARRPVARISPGTAAGIDVGPGAELTVSTDTGAVCLPVVITEMPDDVVWLPQNSPGSRVYRSLGVTAGAVVRIGAAVRLGTER
ncbi:NADH-quinone oxidoreductase subunit G [Skermania piniformis]|uniref:NADH-quinone oxidoreductase n=1 Tax=Skermania pinensis TaxID=39122 RepID=A0ABX8SFK2_9ACTN|nr:NADH-quinone oxidoreductase subunit G [Skermania piniformis]QXQ15395.1 NADH-quinone oxidoreductase subunit G [Skermania piniformis]